jgi:hypothetical protein
MIEIIALVLSLLLLTYFIFRISRRGISKRYERKPENPWSALSEGIDPTI